MKLPAASCGVSNRNSPKPTRLRCSSFGAFAPLSSVVTKLLAKADHPCSKLQGILAKANKEEREIIPTTTIVIPSLR